MAKLHNKVGPPVEGADFFGREKEVRDSWEDLKEGNHLLISAPRRIGKSSLVKRLLIEASDNGWRASYIDVQGLSSEYDFYKLFLQHLKKDGAGWFTKSKDKALENIGILLSKIELAFETEGGSFKLAWNGKEVKDLRDSIESLLDGCKEMLIAIDELPFFLARLEREEDGRQRVSDFLHWLRSFRQKKDNSIRWIFCGSIGLDTFTERLKLTGSFNDVLNFPISAFDDDTASAFLIRLGKDNDLHITQANAEQIIQILGWPLPYFLQAHFKQLKRIKRDSIDQQIQQQEIELAYENIVRDTSSLKTWEERLDEQFAPIQTAQCKLILRNLCQHKKGLTRKKIFDLIYPEIGDREKCDDTVAFLIGVLDRDGYIIEINGYYSFRSPLLRDFWYKMKVR